MFRISFTAKGPPVAACSMGQNTNAPRNVGTGHSAKTHVPTARILLTKPWPVPKTHARCSGLTPAGSDKMLVLGCLTESCRGSFGGEVEIIRDENFLVL